jgi:hypothetical protein
MSAIWYQITVIRHDFNKLVQACTDIMFKVCLEKNQTPHTLI